MAYQLKRYKDIYIEFEKALINCHLDLQYISLTTLFITLILEYRRTYRNGKSFIWIQSIS